MAIAPASPPTNPTLKPSQRAAIEQDYEAANEALTNPKMAPYIQDKAALAKQARNLKKTLDEQAPSRHPNLTKPRERRMPPPNVYGRSKRKCWKGCRPGRRCAGTVMAPCISI
jgi:hypothetical protein